MKVPQPGFCTMHAQVGGNGVCNTECSAMIISTLPVHSYGDLLYPLDRRQASSHFQAALFSAVGSPFVIGIYQGSNQTPAKGWKPPAQANPWLRTKTPSFLLPGVSGLPGGVRHPPELLCTSLLMSIERCGDCPRKCRGLEKWTFNSFVESFLIIFWIALLLTCRLLR